MARLRALPTPHSSAHLSPRLSNMWAQACRRLVHALQAKDGHFDNEAICYS